MENKEKVQGESRRLLLALGMWCLVEEIRIRTRPGDKKFEEKGEKIKNKLLEKLGK